MTTTANRLTFSKTRLAELPVPERGRKYYYDDRTPGFAFCVTDKGARNFYFCAKVAGRSIRTKIGPFPGLPVEQARDIAAKKIGGVANGIDPRRPSASAQPTVQELFDYWLAHARHHKRTWKDDERQFKKYFRPLAGRRLAEVTTEDVSRWHVSIGEKHGRYQANRCRALLSAMFGKADKIGFQGPNPCKGVKRFKETSRDRFLQGRELRPFFAALADEPPVWRDFWLLCLFTGARRGNVAAMAWRDIDLAAAVWYLPGQVTKNGLPLAVVLVPPAVAVLQSRSESQEAPTAWVFPADTRSGHISDPRKSWARVLQRSGIEALRPHDLRRSLGSWQAIAGASLQIVGASLGHRDPKATAVYARLQLDPVRASVHGAVENMLTAGQTRIEDGTLELPAIGSKDGSDEA
jgi:integrase